MMSLLRGSLRSGCRLRALAGYLALALFAASLMGCSLFGKDEDYIPDTPADKLYNEGLYLLNNRQDYKEAAKKFDEVDRQNPYSDWARKALLMSAYAYYQAEEYEECINSAKRYVALHPGSPDAAYAQYLIGASYYDQILDVNHDQGRADKAVGALEEGVRKYAETGYAIRAQRQEKDRHGARPARRQGNGDRPLLHEEARLHRRHQSFQGGGDALPDHARSRGGAGAAARSLYLARHFGRGADRGRRARSQFPG